MSDRSITTIIINYFNNQIYRLEPSGHKLSLSPYAAPVQGFIYKTTEKTQLNKLKASIHQSIQPVKF